jgi:hypothetical protein
MFIGPLAQPQQPLRLQFGIEYGAERRVNPGDDKEFAVGAVACDLRSFLVPLQRDRRNNFVRCGVDDVPARSAC